MRFCYTSEAQKEGHTVCLAKTFQPQLQEKHTCPRKVIKLFSCTVSRLGKRFQEASVHLSVSLWQVLTWPLGYSWRRNSQVSKATAFPPQLVNWEVDFPQISCASTHQFVQGSVRFKAALSISKVEKNSETTVVCNYSSTFQHSLKSKDSRTTANSYAHKLSSSAPRQSWKSMGQ